MRNLLLMDARIRNLSYDSGVSRTMRRIALVMSSLCLTVVSIEATEARPRPQRSFFVATTGDDSLSCAENGSSRPFRTIQRGAKCARRPGDEVVIGRGPIEKP